MSILPTILAWIGTILLTVMVLGFIGLMSHVLRYWEKEIAYAVAKAELNKQRVKQIGHKERQANVDH
jgi:hypothetical protein